MSSSGTTPRRAVILAALLLAAVLVGRGGEASGSEGAGSYGEVGTKPTYSARVAGGDRQASLEDYRGRAVMLNVWATWCVPCKEELPDLQSISEEHGSAGLDVIGVSVDEGNYDGDVLRFADTYGVEFEIWRDPDEDFSRTFRSVGVPETLLLDRDGVVVHRWKGPVQAGPETDRLIRTALRSEGGYGAAASAGTPQAPDGRSLTVAIAFLAGLLSFLSPCVLPLIPSYVALLSGLGQAGGYATPENLGAPSPRVFANGLLFVAGFTAVFVALGASATSVGALVGQYGEWVARVGGVVVLVLGLHLLGVLRIPVLDRDTRFFGKLSGNRRLGQAGALVVGLAFGAGWTPCIGPVLASILALAATTGSVAQGMGLLAVYSAGLAIPFLLATVAFSRFLSASRRFRRFMPWVERASGVLLVLVAVLLLTGSLEMLSAWLSGLGLPEVSL